MTTELGARKFSFALISDTHVNPQDDLCNSPFAVNALANPRFRHTVADLNSRDIAFVVHLGDLVHPVPSSGALYEQAAASFHTIAADLKVPMHVVPGNHDIGDTPVKGAPSGPVDLASIKMWQQHFGQQYSAFSHGGLRYVLLNAQLLNSGLPDEAAQRAWFETELNSTQERVFLMLHHPAYLCTPDEPNHYDNTDEPARGWLLDLLAAHKVEAMFSGHAHNFWYDRYGDTDFYLAPAISFIRQDYAEMARAKPAANAELGRNDHAKLGYFIVTVYENGHSVQVIRTHGAQCRAGQSPTAFETLGPTPRENKFPLLGFDMRQNWAEITEVAPSGGLDEFDRKTVRNDYPLLALIEMGIRDIRIPLSDLRDPMRFARLSHLKHLGFRPTLFTYDIPSINDMNLVERAAHMLTDWEMTIVWSDFAKLLPEIEVAHQKSGLPIYISRMRSKPDLPAGSPYFHVINHGFGLNDAALLSELPNTLISGAVFRLSLAEDVAETLASFSNLARSANLHASVHLRTAGENPALLQDDEDLIVERTKSAMEFVRGQSELRVFSDAFVEADRGFFGKVGSIDRRGNPTALSSLIRRQHFQDWDQAT
jgi:3',5'-cyclic AMP phosphodiesterase CpdA